MGLTLVFFDVPFAGGMSLGGMSDVLGTWDEKN